MNHRVVVVVAILAIMVSATLAFRNPFQPPPPLYNSSDPLALLDVSNIEATVLNSDKAWLVEFYSSWCGHCQHFAPTFKELARSVYGKNSFGHSFETHRSKC
jgi:thiol-disulfide isomerase/thioredoxin